MLVAFSLVNRLNFPADEGGVGHETSFRLTYFCKKGRKRSPATQEGSNQYEAEIHLRMKATHILAPTRSALRVRRALFTNSHVSRKCRAYAVKSGFTPPEGNRYLLLISQMIAWRLHRCQWILVTQTVQAIGSLSQAPLREKRAARVRNVHAVHRIPASTPAAYHSQELATAMPDRDDDPDGAGHSRSRSRMPDLEWLS